MFFRSSIILSITSLAVSCGAPIHSLSSAESAFSDSQKIKDKIQAVISILKEQTGSLGISDLPYLDSIETGDASRCRDFRELTEVQTLPVMASRWKGQKANLQTQQGERLLRGEMWSCVFLNTNVLEFGQNIFNRMKSDMKKLEDPESQKPESSAFKTEVIEKSKFNEKDFSFVSKIHLFSFRKDNGLIDIDNKLVIDGKVFDRVQVSDANADNQGKTPSFIAISVTSTEDGLVKASIINKLKYYVILIPHADDMLMLLTARMDFFSFGVDSVFQSETDKTVGKGLFGIPKMFAN